MGNKMIDKDGESVYTDCRCAALAWDALGLLGFVL